MGERVALLRNRGRKLTLQIRHHLAPLVARLGGDLRRQLRQNVGHIPLNRHVRLLDFTQFGTVDINVNNFRVRAELLGFTNRPVIKTRA